MSLQRSSKNKRSDVPSSRNVTLQDIKKMVEALRVPQSSDRVYVHYRLTQNDKPGAAVECGGYYHHVMGKTKQGAINNLFLIVEKDVERQIAKLKALPTAEYDVDTNEPSL